MSLWIKDRVCINVLGGSYQNALDIYKASKGHALVGILTLNYDNVEAAIKDMEKYNELLEGNLSVGLGSGNPKKQYDVATVAKYVKCKHYNQVFTYVSATRANNSTDEAIINALVSPSGEIGKVIISTGPLSSNSTKPAMVDIYTAIDMVRDMGGTSIKFFPMHGLKCKDELIGVAKACKEKDMWLEPTGGIDLDNFEEIIKICLDNGVPKIIPHIYSSIIDSETGSTKIDDVIKLIDILETIL